MYYPYACVETRRRIGLLDPSARAKKAEPVQPTLSHFLWALDQLQHFPNNMQGAVKATAWLTWICVHAEVQGLWDNDVSQMLRREDVQLGRDVPIVCDIEEGLYLFRRRWKDQYIRRLCRQRDDFFLEIVSVSERNGSVYVHDSTIQRVSAEVAAYLRTESDVVRLGPDECDPCWTEQWYMCLSP